MLNGHKETHAPAAAPKQPKRTCAHWEAGHYFFHYLVGSHHGQQAFLEEWLQELFWYLTEVPAGGFNSALRLREHATNVYRLGVALEHDPSCAASAPKALRNYWKTRFDGQMDKFTTWLHELYMFIALEPEPGRPRCEAPALRRHLTHLHYLQQALARFTVEVPEYLQERTPHRSACACA